MSGLTASTMNMLGMGRDKKKKSNTGKFGKLTAEEQAKLSQSGAAPRPAYTANTLLGGKETLGG